jgi:hypothetical protein
MGKVVTFGEIMLRLAPPGFLRFEQASSFDVQFGGGEANVAVSLARFGVPTEYVTRLPRNEIADAAVAFLRGHGVGVGHMLRGGSLFGPIEHVGVYPGSADAAALQTAEWYQRAFGWPVDRSCVGGEPPPCAERGV